MSAASDAPRVGGLLLRVDGDLRFAPATVALRVVAPPRVTSVPGAPPALLGVALHEGVVVPVIAIGSARGNMLVCQHAGELVGIVGGEVVRTGSFSRTIGSPDCVQHDGRSVEALDVGGIYAQIQSRARPVRWG
jgi:chemotaxis signal transduction protein